MFLFSNKMFVLFSKIYTWRLIIIPVNKKDRISWKQRNIQTKKQTIKTAQNNKKDVKLLAQPIFSEWFFASSLYVSISKICLARMKHLCDRNYVICYEPFLETTKSIFSLLFAFCISPMILVMFGSYFP